MQLEHRQALLESRIMALIAVLSVNPTALEVEYEIDHLVAIYDRLERAKRLGFTVVEGGRQASNSSTLRCLKIV